MKTLREIKDEEYNFLKNRRENKRIELEQELKDALVNEKLSLISIVDNNSEFDDGYKVTISFVLDEYIQEDMFYWNTSESQNEFIDKVKKSIDYIKELRENYPEYCKQNDYIQLNSKFEKRFSITDMGYKKDCYVGINLASYLKLPNTTSCSCGGGDYEIKRTPKRVEEYNKNIDIVIDNLLDCIAELKMKKYKI
jgi:hypothetical protein